MIKKLEFKELKERNKLAALRPLVTVAILDVNLNSEYIGTVMASLESEVPVPAIARVTSQ